MIFRHPTHVTKREFVTKLAASEPEKALDVARIIPESWYRCQALAHVACNLKQRKLREEIIHEALKAAYELREPNRIVSVAAWPVRAMVAGGDRRLESVVDELLHRIQVEPNPVRRADALLLLFEAVYYEARVREVVLEVLLRACEEMNSWKRPHILSDIALVLAIDDPARAAQIVELIGEGRMGRKTRREISAGSWLGPHEFFPYYAKPATTS